MRKENLLDKAQINYLNLHSDEVIDRLIKVIDARGLKNADICRLTWWPASKTSKILNKTQKPSATDLKLLAKAVGYTPEIFLLDNYDIRGYVLSDAIRCISDCVREVYAIDGTISSVDSIQDIVSYEMPLAIIDALNVEPTNYVTKSCIDEKYDEAEMTSSDSDEFVGEISVVLYHRNVTSYDGYTPYIQLLIDDKRNTTVVGLFLRDSEGHLDPKERKKFKNIILANDSDQEWNKLENSDSYWEKMKWSENEIESVIYSKSDIINHNIDKTINMDLSIMLDKYCELVFYLSKGIDIKERKTDITTKDIFSAITGNDFFSEETIAKVLRSRKNKCEIDPEHTSFIDEAGKPYMTVECLLPSFSGYPLEIIKSEANCICLCPNCAAQLRHGSRKDRERMFFTLYREHEAALRNQGVDLSLGDVLKLNEL
ncbi:hypothetical protein [Butyrivibrio sp. AD3002]|uniref:hypothetical protein n=1 Tax=Butyrivibrio sp. AD3002 TaxID=1280670 RepID=UPI0003B47491|nr:hypothetical protein [Butyrivibrio sp. AD3002]